MKSIIKQIAFLFLAGTFAVSSCKKNDSAPMSPDAFATKEFQFNLATRKFAPEIELNANIKSSAGIKLVYYYLLRGNFSPLLVHTEEPTPEHQSDYTFTIPNSAFAQLDMESVEGLKIMVKHLDNSSSEGFV